MRGVNTTADIHVSIDWRELGESFSTASSTEQAQFLEGMGAGFDSIGWAATDSQLLEISLEMSSPHAARVLEVLTNWVQEPRGEE